MNRTHEQREHRIATSIAGAGSVADVVAAADSTADKIASGVVAIDNLLDDAFLGNIGVGRGELISKNFISIGKVFLLLEFSSRHTHGLLTLYYSLCSGEK